MLSKVLYASIASVLRQYDRLKPISRPPDGPTLNANPANGRSGGRHGGNIRGNGCIGGNN